MESCVDPVSAEPVSRDLVTAGLQLTWRRQRTHLFIGFYILDGSSELAGRYGALVNAYAYGGGPSKQLNR